MHTLFGSNKPESCEWREIFSGFLEVKHMCYDVLLAVFGPFERLPAPSDFGAASVVVRKSGRVSLNYIWSFPS
jgi:hypothetical protein